MVDIGCLLNLFLTWSMVLDDVLVLLVVFGLKFRIMFVLKFVVLRRILFRRMNCLLRMNGRDVGLMRLRFLDVYLI